MEVMGYVIGVLTFLVGLAVKLVRGVDTTLLTATASIKDEFKFAYHEFGSVSCMNDRESRMIDVSVARLSRLHSSSASDLVRLRLLDWVLSKTTMFVYSPTVSAAISLILAHFKIIQSHPTLKPVFFLVIPLVALCFQGLFVAWIISQERYLKRVAERYKRCEY